MQLLNGLAWSEYLSQAEQLGLDSSYDYDHGTGQKPTSGFPGTTVAIGTCYDPFTYEQYGFNVVILDPTFFCYDPFTAYSADGVATGDWLDSDWNWKVQYALFYTTDSLNGDTPPTGKLVKASDRINTSYTYGWLPVLTVRTAQEE